MKFNILVYMEKSVETIEQQLADVYLPKELTFNEFKGYLGYICILMNVDPVRRVTKKFKRLKSFIEFDFNDEHIASDLQKLEALIIQGFTKRIKKFKKVIKQFDSVYFEESVKMSDLITSILSFYESKIKNQTNLKVTDDDSIIQKFIKDYNTSDNDQIKEFVKTAQSFIIP